MDYESFEPLNGILIRKKTGYPLAKAMQFGGLVFILGLLIIFNNTSFQYFGILSLQPEFLIAMIGGGAWLSFGAIAWECKWEHIDLFLRIASSSCYVFGSFYFLLFLSNNMIQLTRINSFILITGYLSVSEAFIWYGFTLKDWKQNVRIPVSILKAQLPNLVHPVFVYENIRAEFGRPDIHNKAVNPKMNILQLDFRWRKPKIHLIFQMDKEDVKEVIFRYNSPRVGKRIISCVEMMIKSQSIQNLDDVLRRNILPERVEALDEIVNYITLGPLMLSIIPIWGTAIEVTARVCVAFLLLVLWGIYKTARVRNSITLRIGVIMTLYTMLAFFAYIIPIILLNSYITSTIPVVPLLPFEQSGLATSWIILIATLLVSLFPFVVWPVFVRHSGLEAWNYIKADRAPPLENREEILSDSIEIEGNVVDFEIYNQTPIETIHTAYEEAACIMSEISRKFTAVLVLLLVIVFFTLQSIIDILSVVRWFLAPAPFAALLLLLSIDKSKKKIRIKSRTALDLIDSFST